MSTTYSDLVTNIKNWCGRTDSKTLNAIPGFINNAQTALDADLLVGGTISTVTFNQDGDSVDISEFADPQSVTINGLVGTSTTYAKITAMRDLVAARPETTGYDFHYAMNGNSVELVKPAVVTITGYKNPPRISDSVQTNAYTEEAEDALLWSALYYCAVFCRDPDAATSFKDMATDEVTKLNNARDKFVKTGTAKVKRRGYF